MKQIRDDRDAGFTLIELLVVVIIIGILAAIAIPVFLNQRDSARRAAVESDLRNAAIQVETFYTQNTNYPADAAELLAAGPVTISDGVGAVYTFNAADQSYTIEGCNLLASDQASTYFKYDSALGGLQDGATGTCPTAEGLN